MSELPLPRYGGRQNAVRVVDSETGVTIMIAADQEALRLAMLEALARLRPRLRQRMLREDAPPGLAKGEG